MLIISLGMLGLLSGLIWWIMPDPRTGKEFTLTQWGYTAIIMLVLFCFAIAPMW